MTPAYVSVYPQEGQTYPDALGVPITSAGATVAWSKYILDALDKAFLLLDDPYGVYQPDDRTGDAGGGAVRSVFGRTGDIVAASGDYAVAQITGLTSALAAKADSSSLTSGLATKAPVSSPYVTFSSDATLTGDRVLTAGAGVAFDTSVAGQLIINASSVGDVAGPAGATDNRVARFDGVTGKLIQQSVVAIDDAGAVSGITDLTLTGNVTVSGTVDGVDVSTLPTADAARTVGPASSTDNTLPRFDGATGKLLQGSGVVVDDSNNISGVGTLATGSQTVTGNITVSGTVDGVDVSNLNTTVSGKVTGPASAVDNSIARFDLTTGKVIQASQAFIDDAGNTQLGGTLSSGTITVTGNIVINGTVDGRDVSVDGAKLDGIAPNATALLLSSSTPALVSETSGSVGAGTTAAKADHVHQLPLRTITYAPALRLCETTGAESYPLWGPDVATNKKSDGLVYRTDVDPSLAADATDQWAKWRIPVPAGLVSITGAVAVIQGGASHSALPATMPKVYIEKHSRSGTTVSITTTDTVTDPSASTAAFEAAHTVTLTASSSNYTAGDKYFLVVNGEAGTNAKTGMKVLWAEVTLSVRG